MSSRYTLTAADSRTGLILSRVHARGEHAPLWHGFPMILLAKHPPLPSRALEDVEIVALDDALEIQSGGARAGRRALGPRRRAFARARDERRASGRRRAKSQFAFDRARRVGLDGVASLYYFSRVSRLRASETVSSVPRFDRYTTPRRLIERRART